MITEVRHKNEISIDDALDILKLGQYGTLSTISHNGYPYSMPLSYVYHNGDIYFHSSVSEHKLENLEMNDKVSFAVSLDLGLIPNEFSNKYKSVVVFGKAKEISGEEKENALIAIMEKYSKEFLSERKRYIDAIKNKTRIIKIEINHIAGTESV